MKLTAIALSLLFLPGTLEAETLKFPKDNPQFSVTFNDNWRAEILSSGIISAQPKGVPYAISIFSVSATTAPGAIDETFSEVGKRFTNIKEDEPGEFTNKTGVKFLERDLTGEDAGSARQMAIVAFAVGPGKYFALFQAGTPAT